MIRLFTTWYDEKRADRREEYVTCLRRNLECAAIDEVRVLHEGGELPDDPGGKLRVQSCATRPTYNDFFELINEVVSDDDLSIIANTDIHFDEGLRVLPFLDWDTVRRPACHAVADDQQASRRRKAASHFGENRRSESASHTGGSSHIDLPSQRRQRLAKQDVPAAGEGRPAAQGPVRPSYSEGSGESPRSPRRGLGAEPRFPPGLANACLALSRWDVGEDGKAVLFERGDSQDTWVFRGHVREANGDFPLGAWDCDNKIAWELERAGFEVRNPALSLRTYHIHHCGYRSYEEDPPDFGICPPFRYVTPETFGSLWTCYRLYHQAQMPYFPWMLTRSKVARFRPINLMLRALNKARRAMCSAEETGAGCPTATASLPDPFACAQGRSGLAPLPPPEAAPSSNDEDADSDSPDPSK